MTDEGLPEGTSLEELFAQLRALREVAATVADADVLVGAITDLIAAEDPDRAGAVAAAVDLEVAEMLFRQGDRVRAGPVARRAADRFAIVVRAPAWLGDPVSLRLNALRFSVLSRATVDDVERDLGVIRGVRTDTPRQVRGQVQALRAAENLLWNLGDMERFEQLTEEIERLSVRGDSQCQAMAMRMRSKFLRRVGRYVEARTAAEQALASASTSTSLSRGNCLLELAFVMKGLGEVDQAMRAINEALELFPAEAKRGRRTSLDVAAMLETDDNASLARLNEALSLVGADGVGGSTLFLHRGQLGTRLPHDRMSDLEEALRRALATYGFGRLAAEVAVQIARVARRTPVNAPADLREVLAGAAEWASASLHPGLAGEAAMELARLDWVSGQRGGVVDRVLRATELLDRERRLLTTDDDRFRVAEQRRDDLLFAVEVIAEAGTALDAAVVIEQLRAQAVALATSTGLDALPEEAQRLIARIAAAQEAESSIAVMPDDDDGETVEADNNDPEGGVNRRRRAVSHVVAAAWAEASRVLSAAVLTAMSPRPVDRRSLEATCAALDGVWLSYEVTGVRDRVSFPRSDGHRA